MRVNELVDELRTAVDRLIEPRRQRIMQRNEAGIECSSVIEADALIAQLRVAVNGGMESGGGGSTASNERIPFDATAQALYDEVRSGVAGLWSKRTGGRVSPEDLPEALLRHWFELVDQDRHEGRVDPFREEGWLQQLNGWAVRIEGLFDPPKQLEVTAACPRCDERWAFDRRTGDRITALIIVWPRAEQANLADAMIRCRSCGIEWKGERGVRTLSLELDNPQLLLKLTA